MTSIVEFYVPETTRKIAIKDLGLHITDKKNCSIIEQGIYDHTKQFCLSNNENLPMAKFIYTDKVDDILYNLKQNGATIVRIKKEIAKKKYNPYNLAFLTPDELDEDKWMKIILRKHTTEDKLKNLPAIEGKPCRNCKSTQFFFYQEQTRSADEPMTTYYICKNCDKTYKVNN